MVVISLFMGAAGAVILYRAVAPFRRIWSGDAKAVRDVPTRTGPLKARNYLVYLAWVIPGSSGLLLGGIALACSTFVDAGSRIALIIFQVAAGLFLVAWPLALLHLAVDLTARPGFLVPPPYRHQPGTIASLRDRMRRQRKGQAPTDHLVEIIEIAGDDGRPAWQTALCSEPECGWTTDVKPSHDTLQAEAELRAKIRKHTHVIATRWTDPDRLSTPTAEQDRS